MSSDVIQRNTRRKRDAALQRVIGIQTDELAIFIFQKPKKAFNVIFRKPELKLANVDHPHSRPHDALDPRSDLAVNFRAFAHVLYFIFPHLFRIFDGF